MSVVNKGTNTVQVVAALLRDGERFLICQRPANKARALLWEFVGGKVEPGETKAEALRRECREELDIDVDVGSVYTAVDHVYPDITIRLTLFNARLSPCSKPPRALEHNAIRWITPAEIPQYEFCPADKDILTLIAREEEDNKMLNSKRIDLTDDGRVFLVPYILDASPEMPLSKGRPALMVIPGGGYNALSDREGEPIAMAFAAQGFQTFVLHYSVREYASFPNPLVDLMRAMKVVRDNAEAWNIDPGHIAAVGFSAGGHLAASLGVYWNDPEINALAGVNAEEARPDALILCYPVITSQFKAEQGTIRTAARGHENEPDIIDKLSLDKHVGPHTPPCYIAHTFFDSVVPVENSLAFANALAAAEVPFELHITQDGVHGLALGNHVTSIGPLLNNSKFTPWVGGAGDWMRRLFGYEGPEDMRYPSALTRRRGQS
ncbi:MAG: NUDIX domain-containing protein [Clostridia bacterium]|nr:NUDIX domain-containing protein [Clostridia bacterium]MBR0157578.1 NUDIX domain-containing protein [Clostridia bacterium]